MKPGWEQGTGSLRLFLCPCRCATEMALGAQLQGGSLEGHMEAKGSYRGRPLNRWPCVFEGPQGAVLQLACLFSRLPGQETVNRFIQSIRPQTLESSLAPIFPSYLLPTSQCISPHAFQNVRRVHALPSSPLHHPTQSDILSHLDNGFPEKYVN